MEIGILVCIWNDAHLEGVFGRAAYREANPIDGDATLVYRKIPTAYHLPVRLVPESILMATTLFLHGDAGCRLVDMSLYYVAVKPAVHHHATFHVDLISYLQQPKVASFECFPHGCHGI